MTRAIRRAQPQMGMAMKLMLAGIITLLLNAGVLAHEMRPAIATGKISESGLLEMRVALNLEARIAGIGANHSDTAQSKNAPVYDQLRAAEPAALESAAARIKIELVKGLWLFADGRPVQLTLDKMNIPGVGDTALSRTSTLVLAGAIPPNAGQLTWQSSERHGDTVIRLTRSGENEPFYAAFLSAGSTSDEISLDGVVRTQALSGFMNYVVIGFEHILPKGLDHILFVVGLFLLSPHLRPLMWQVTGFTLAHSATLALGIYGFVRIPSAIVEPLIAASIAFIAIENLFTDRLSRWRPAVVFGFGLLHGLGFAGVLSQVGLPQSQFVTALIGFNIGVEFGQLAVLAACFLGVGLWLRHRHWYRRAISMPASIAVALIAVFWFVERMGWS